MQFPAFQDAKLDKALRGDISIVLYLHLLDELDPVEFKEVKRVVLANRLDVSENAVRRALKKLVTRGYLRRARGKPGEPHRYRLVYTRMP
jgi:predicted ArsR family transcriptional regulator